RLVLSARPRSIRSPRTRASRRPPSTLPSTQQTTTTRADTISPRRAAKPEKRGGRRRRIELGADIAGAELATATGGPGSKWAQRVFCPDLLAPGQKERPSGAAAPCR